MAAEQVAPGIWAVDQSVVAGKNGVVVGGQRAVAVDAGNSRADGQALVDVLRTAGHGPDRPFAPRWHAGYPPTPCRRPSPSPSTSATACRRSAGTCRGGT